MKKLHYVLVGLCLLGGIALSFLLFLFEPNQFKDHITHHVQRATGQELIITGDLSWQIFPNIRLKLGETSLRNPPSFKEENLLTFSEAELNVKLLPLFSQHLDISEIKLSGARIFLEKKADGSTNLDGFLTPKQEQSEASPATANTDNNQKPWTIKIADVSIENANLLILDDRDKSQTAINSLNLNLKGFALNNWSSLSFDFKAKRNDLHLASQASLQVLLPKDMHSFEFKNIDIKGDFKQGSLSIEAFSLLVDQLRMEQKGNLTLTAKGKNNDLHFSTNIKTELGLAADFTQFFFDKNLLEIAVANNSLPSEVLDLKISGTASFDTKTQLLDLPTLTIAVEDTEIKGQASYQASDIHTIRFDLKSDFIDIDSLLKNTESKDSASTSIGDDKSGQSTKSPPLSNVEPDLTILKEFDLEGTIALGSLKAGGITSTNILSAITMQKGLATLRTSASLYEGQLTGWATLDAKSTPASYQIQKHLTGVNAMGLLKDLTGKQVLSGTMDIKADLIGTGLSPQKIREGIQGHIAAKVYQGAVWGFDLPEMIHKANNLLKGQSKLSELKSFSEGQKTDFNTLVANIALDRGEANIITMFLDSPLLDITGSGSTNLLSETLHLKFSAEVVGSSDKGEGLNLFGLKGFIIPVDIKGTWEKPKIRLSIEDLIKERARKGIQKGMQKIFRNGSEEKNIENSAEKLLKKFLY